jgi:hypothetical protein
LHDPQPQSEITKTTSTLAMVALVLSVSGFLLAPFVPLGTLTVVPLGAAAGIGCGRRALQRMRKDPTLLGKGFAVAAITVGYLLLAIWLVLSVFFLAYPRID